MFRFVIHKYKTPFPLIQEKLNLFQIYFCFLGFKVDLMYICRNNYIIQSIKMPVKYNRIDDILEEKGLSRKGNVVAEKMGVNVSTFSSWRTQNSQPKPKNVNEFVKAVNKICEPEIVKLNLDISRKTKEISECSNSTTIGDLKVEVTVLKQRLLNMLKFVTCKDVWEEFPKSMP